MADLSDPGSGVEERAHGDDCQCTRCVGFQKGHELSLRHGAYATLRLAPRAAEIAAEIREVVPGYRPADEGAVQDLAIVRARIEAAEQALAAVDALLGSDHAASEEAKRQLRAYMPKANADTLAPDFQRLRDDLKGWIRLSRSLANDLGLTPTSRARLGVDVSTARRVMTLTDLAVEAAEERRAEATEGGSGS